MFRHWLVTFIHPFFHKPGIREACWVCAMVWRKALKDPEFVEALEAGIADIKAGRVHKWSDVKRELDA